MWPLANGLELRRVLRNGPINFPELGYTIVVHICKSIQLHRNNSNM